MLKFMFLLLAILSATVSITSAIKCYDCNLFDCNDSDDLPSKTCSEPNMSEKFLNIKYVCVKIVYQVEDSKVTKRGCGKKAEVIDPCNSMEALAHCSSCDTDLCNETNKLSTSSVVIILSAVLAIKSLLLR